MSFDETRETPNPAKIMLVVEELKKIVRNRDAPLMDVVQWMEDVAKRGMPGVRPQRVTHRVDRSNTPTPLDKRHTQFFFLRTEKFPMKLVGEIGTRQIRHRVYEVAGAGFVLTRTTYNAWGEYHYDELMSITGGPIVSKEWALEVAHMQDEAREKQFYATEEPIP